MLKELSLIFVIAVLVFGAREAKADEYWSAMQVTCDKNLNYFTFKTIAVDDLYTYKNPVEGKNVDQKSGIFRLGDYTCDLPAFTDPSIGNMKFPERRITVGITSKFDGVVPKPSPIHQCAISNDIELNISVNGIAAGKFDAYAESCGDLVTHFIEIDPFSQLTDCTLVTESSIGDEESKCSRKQIKTNQ